MTPAAWVVLAALSSGSGEGVLIQKLTLPQGSGEQRTFLSERGLRSEVELQVKDQTVRTAFVAEAGTGRGYRLDDQGKTYKEVALTAAAGASGFPVTQQPSEVLLGRECRHVQLQLAPDSTVDYWTTREQLGPRALELIPIAAQLPAGIRAALQSVDADGLVMKMVQRKAGQVLVSLEPISFKAAAVPPSGLKVPPDYRPAPAK